MRPARHDDIDYFIRAGREFCKETPFAFNAEDYAERVHKIINDPNTVSIVNGDPVCCHSAATLYPSMYDASQIIARVFTTWGPGGLDCFVEVEHRCRDRGAAFIMADSYIAPRIMRFYKRRGMKRADSVFIKAL